MKNKWRDSGRKFISEDPGRDGLDWSNRHKIICEKIKELPIKQVHDFGSGECRLFEFCNENSLKYFAYDTENFSLFKEVDVKKTDLNNFVPKFKGRKSNCIVMQGLLEYIDDVEKIIIESATQSSIIILTTSPQIEDMVEVIVEKYNFELLSKTPTIEKPPSQNVWVIKT